MAEFLEGTELADGWRVVSRVQRNPTATGGNFSIGYIVERSVGRAITRAFLKVLNLRTALSAADPLREIERLTTAFNFERDTLTFCKNERLRRVATIIEDGQYTPPNSQIPIFYIIVELADGDIREQLAQVNRLNMAWTFRTLHHITTALQQLHTHGIAHQDLKPSNVLIFGVVGAKVSDLGCADSRGKTSPRGHLTVAGDFSYAPPELLYNEVSQDWCIRRQGCDLYLLGSLVVFFFTGGCSLTASILSHLHGDHRPGRWPHDYRSVLPYVRDAFEGALETIALSIPPEVRSHVITTIRCLCDPDPRLRGDQIGGHGSQFNLERIISRFDVLATRAQHGLLAQ
ncbi:MAG: protein kinase [Verrucomicrobia bacterium]|nr:protein kinase [Verrucomicrobiota bacterium]